MYFLNGPYTIFNPLVTSRALSAHRVVHRGESGVWKRGRCEVGRPPASDAEDESGSRTLLPPSLPDRGVDSAR